MVRPIYLSVSVGFFLLALGSLMPGCGILYRSAGFSTADVAKLEAEDNVFTREVVTYLRALSWETVYGVTALLGGVLTGWLGLRVRTERKITKAVIQGVEKGSSKGAKPLILKEAMKLRVSKALHRRVKKLT